MVDEVTGNTPSVASQPSTVNQTATVVPPTVVTPTAPTVVPPTQLDQV